MGFVCSSSVSTLKFDDSQLKSDIGARVSFFMLQLKECGNHVNTNIYNYKKSGVYMLIYAP